MTWRFTANRESCNESIGKDHLSAKAVIRPLAEIDPKLMKLGATILLFWVQPQTSSGGFNDKLQLGPLLFFGQEVAFHGGSESALRAERELLERKEAGCFVDSPKKIVLALEFGPLRADEAEDNDFAFRNKAQRLKGAGALVVVFEQEAVNGKFVEETLSDGVVSAFCVPVAAIVAAAKVDGESDV